jgi:hypothetical protein
MLGSKRVVLLVTGENLVLNELADIGQGKRFLARSACEDVLHHFGVS